MTSPNPFVAARGDAPVDPWADVWLAEDVEQIAESITNGSWIDASLGAAAAGLDALAFVSDPIGSLSQYGVAWIIEHGKPLSEALDWLALRRSRAGEGRRDDGGDHRGGRLSGGGRANDGARRDRRAGLAFDHLRG